MFIVFLAIYNNAVQASDHVKQERCSRSINQDGEPLATVTTVISYSWFRLNVTSAESSVCSRRRGKSLSQIWLWGACCHDNWSSVCAVMRVKAILTWRHWQRWQGFFVSLAEHFWKRCLLLKILSISATKKDWLFFLSPDHIVISRNTLAWLFLSYTH